VEEVTNEDEELQTKKIYSQGRVIGTTRTAVDKKTTKNKSRATSKTKKNNKNQEVEIEIEHIDQLLITPYDNNPI